MSALRTGYALDASALLAVMHGETGNQEVLAILDRAYIHAVNAAEVISKLIRSGVPETRAREMIDELGVDIGEEFGILQAARCGNLIAKTRAQGLSLGDCICLTAATWSNSIAVTADRRWSELHGQRIDKTEIRVQVIR